jgi:hypothetical protein
LNSRQNRLQNQIANTAPLLVRPVWTCRRLRGGYNNQIQARQDQDIPAAMALGRNGVAPWAKPAVVPEPLMGAVGVDVRLFPWLGGSTPNPAAGRLLDPVRGLQVVAIPPATLHLQQAAVARVSRGQARALPVNRDAAPVGQPVIVLDAERW